MPAAIKYTDQQLAEIQHLYLQERLSVRQVAKRTGFKAPTLKTLLKKMGVIRSSSDALRERLEGQKFGRLTVISYLGGRRYSCQCECGNTTESAAYSLKSGDSGSCGCKGHETCSKLQAIDMLGHVSGLLTVVSKGKKLNTKTDRQQYWNCACACGGSKEVSGNHLRKNIVKSCGCLLGGWDSIGAFLDGSFRNAKADSEFYLYGLANHALIKAGIDSTGNRADEEYGEQLLAIELPRFEAWLLEQAFLKETAHLRVTPVGLCEWAGRSEIRDIQESAAIDLAVQLHDQLLELGPKEFALRFIPATPAQRKALVTMDA